MVFNKILTPQDSFTETNVTRKRSVVRNSRLHSQNHFIQNFIFLLLFYFFCLFYMSLKNMRDDNETTCHTKTMHKDKNVRKKKDIKIIHTKIRIKMIISLSQIFIYSAKSNKHDSLADNKWGQRVKKKNNKLKML